jgi:hypothetical protein
MRAARLLPLLAASSALAGEPGGLAALQAGALGDCPLFASFETIETEASLQLMRAEGRADAGATQMRSTSRRSATELGAALPLGTDISFSTSARFEERSYEASTSGASYREDAESDRVDFAAGPAVWFGSFGIGGQVGIASLGEETISTAGGSGDVSRVVEPSVTPMLTAFAGLRTTRLLGAVQIRGYDAASTKVTTRDVDGLEYQSEINRRPAESLALHTRFALLPTLDVALGTRYTADARDSNDAVVRTAHWSLTAGGIYRTPAGVGLVTSYRHVEEAYDDAHRPSLLHENLGGPRLAVGLLAAVRHLSFQLDMGYESSGKARYRPAPSTGSLVASGDGTTTVEQKTWDIAAGLSARF